MNLCIFHLYMCKYDDDTDGAAIFTYFTSEILLIDTR